MVLDPEQQLGVLAVSAVDLVCESLLAHVLQRGDERLYRTGGQFQIPVPHEVAFPRSVSPNANVRAENREAQIAPSAQAGAHPSARQA